MEAEGVHQEAGRGSHQEILPGIESGLEPVEDKSRTAVQDESQAAPNATQGGSSSPLQDPTATFLEGGLVRGGAMPVLLEAAARASRSDERLVILKAMENTALSLDTGISGRLARFVELGGVTIIRDWLAGPAEDVRCIRACLVVLRLLPLRRSDVLSLNLLTLAASRAEQLPELREEVEKLVRTWQISLKLKGTASLKRKREAEEAETLSEISHLGRVLQERPKPVPTERPRPSVKPELLDQHFEDPFA
ncbi:HERC6 [Symbiodinium pilosum]|uniref:HERC6 protein n=1 Tax=Symbiodinium pilosum TaxID=2952 RepID=A0A812IRC7_SYMPI|nr:HERC6 [Symbiodinium pilosum]